MPVSDQKAALKSLRDNPEAIARLLNQSLATSELEPVLIALNQILIAQNVAAIARESGMRRDKLYGSFGGRVDPVLSRVLKLLSSLNVRLLAVPSTPKSSLPQRPKLGRPKKK
jgi:probable addiction module antidote protein